MWFGICYERKYGSASSAAVRVALPTHSVRGVPNSLTSEELIRDRFAGLGKLTFHNAAASIHASGWCGCSSDQAD